MLAVLFGQKAPTLQAPSVHNSLVQYIYIEEFIWKPIEIDTFWTYLYFLYSNIPYMNWEYFIINFEFSLKE